MIYFVEDDKNIRELVVYTLERSGFYSLGCADAKEFFSVLQPESTQLVLLDIMLPEEDGLSVLKKLRASRSTEKIPIIMLTALGSEYDKVIGLDSGADDYITKPFGMMELLARVRTQLRRNNDDSEKILSAGKVVLSVRKRSVIMDGTELQLTFKEFELLRFLLENKGNVMSRQQLLDSLWGYDFEGETRTVDVHIRTLRQKLGSEGTIIETVRGVGYKVVSP